MWRRRPHTDACMLCLHALPRVAFGGCHSAPAVAALLAPPQVWMLGAASALLGCYRGIYSAALEAIWADSIAAGRRQAGSGREPQLRLIALGLCVTGAGLRGEPPALPTCHDRGQKAPPFQPHPLSSPPSPLSPPPGLQLPLHQALRAHRGVILLWAMALAGALPLPGQPVARARLPPGAGQRAAAHGGATGAHVPFRRRPDARGAATQGAAGGGAAEWGAAGSGVRAAARTPCGARSMPSRWGACQLPGRHQRLCSCSRCGGGSRRRGSRAAGIRRQRTCLPHDRGCHWQRLRPPTSSSRTIPKRGRAVCKRPAEPA